MEKQLRQIKNDLNGIYINCHSFSLEEIEFQLKHILQEFDKYESENK